MPPTCFTNLRSKLMNYSCTIARSAIFHAHDTLSGRGPSAVPLQSNFIALRPLPPTCFTNLRSKLMDYSCAIARSAIFHAHDTLSGRGPSAVLLRSNFIALLTKNFTNIMLTYFNKFCHRHF